MKYNNFRRLIQQIAAVGFCFILLLEAAMNTKRIVSYTEDFSKGQCSFPEIKKKIEDFYISEEFLGKIPFLELNGLIARHTGRRAYNDVTLYEDGMLGGGAEGFLCPYDTDALAEKVPCFSEVLDSLGIPFVYVQAPYKMDMGGQLLPKGLKDSPNEFTDYFVRSLKKEGVSVLDLRQELTADIRTTEMNFYRTDHHWTPDGAMIAFHRVMEYLKNEIDPGTDIDLSYPDHWERHAKEKWFLGSSGKRVGPLYAGVDPLIWYTPRFMTKEMSCGIPDYGLLYEGDFSEANMRQEYIDEKDYYSKIPYCVYIGGDYPVVKHRNPHAPNKKKILIIKDSFVLPVQAFMSTEFTEMDVIDPRYFKEDITEYCRMNRPDVVIMMIHVNCIFNTDYLNIISV